MRAWKHHIQVLVKHTNALLQLHIAASKILEKQIDNLASNEDTYREIGEILFEARVKANQSEATVWLATASHCHKLARARVTKGKKTLYYPQTKEWLPMTPYEQQVLVEELEVLEQTALYRIIKKQMTAQAMEAATSTQQPIQSRERKPLDKDKGKKKNSSREEVTCANNASYPIKGVGTLENGLFVLDCYEKQIQACIAETKTQAMQDAELWHARFGHVGYGSLMTLQRHNMVHDLSLLEMPPRHVCEGCVLGKMHRFAFSQDGSVRATRKLQLVHSDVLLGVSTQNKVRCVCNFQHYVSMVENETGCKVQTLCTDRGGEYMSSAFKDFLGKKGIKHRCTMPYTSQQNGVAKRKNRSLMEMARYMLKAKSLPHKLWMEAVACAAHVLNRCPTRALKTITPYESWYDRKPSASYLRVFGCLAYAHIPQQLRGKLDNKAVKCIFVGYSSGSKGYRLYNPATNKIFESRDVIFAKTTAQPMVAFDVPHMQTQDVFEGFLPSFVENQESQQVDNFDQSFDQHVTPHDVEKIVHEEQEVLREERTLPKWVQKT
ncbi:hypothetical protein L7F22_021740 [Adiantum nelumboides]|nr:hypothetical protein [Adiantum nelumboides]